MIRQQEVEVARFGRPSVRPAELDDPADSLVAFGWYGVLGADSLGREALFGPFFGRQGNYHGIDIAGNLARARVVDQLAVDQHALPGRFFLDNFPAIRGVTSADGVSAGKGPDGQKQHQHGLEIEALAGIEDHLARNGWPGGLGGLFAWLGGFSAWRNWTR